jgi:hypothetical protein
MMAMTTSNSIRVNAVGPFTLFMKRFRAGAVRKSGREFFFAKAIEKPRFKTLCEAWLAGGAIAPGLAGRKSWMADIENQSH